MFSMTGYGKAEYNENNISIVVEVKSVNNRVFDFNAKMPRAFIMYEDALRKIVNGYISRGRVDLFVNFSDARERSVDLTVNLEKAASYYSAAKIISDKIGIPNDCTVTQLMHLPDIVSENVSSDVGEFDSVLKDTVSKACDAFNAMRATEGEKLVSDMLARMSTIAEITESIAERAPLVCSEYKAKLKSRIEEALSGVEYDEGKLLSEVAFFTDRANIDEELTRLRSHIAQFNQIVKTDRCGKKLDFLMQEFNRETNTICSKANDIVITEYALSLKNEIEKVREQVQNIE